MSAKTRVERGDTGRIVALAVILKLLVLWLGIQAFIVSTNEPLSTPQQWLEIWNRWAAPHFLALVRASFLAARGGRWASAGVAGAFASLARVNGLLLVPALAVEALVEYRRTRKFNAAWLWIALAGVGFLGYLLLNKQVTGDF